MAVRLGLSAGGGGGSEKGRNGEDVREAVVGRRADVERVGGEGEVVYSLPVGTERPAVCPGLGVPGLSQCPRWRSARGSAVRCLDGDAAGRKGKERRSTHEGRRDKQDRPEMQVPVRPG